MKVVVVEPLRGSYVKEIPSGLKSLQHEVDGDIEVIYPFEDDVALICNEEGKMIGLEPNRVMTDENGAIYDIIFGTFLIVGLTEENFGSLSEKQIEIYLKMYSEPEYIPRNACTVF